MFEARSINGGGSSSWMTDLGPMTSTTMKQLKLNMNPGIRVSKIQSCGTNEEPWDFGVWSTDEQAQRLLVENRASQPVREAFQEFTENHSKHPNCQPNLQQSSHTI